MVCKTVLALVILSIVFSGALPGPTSQASEEKAQLEHSVTLVRNVNSAEMLLYRKTRSFVNLEGLMNQPTLADDSISLVSRDSFSADVKNFVLTVLASSDGKHFHVSMVPTKGTCETAVFSDEAGLVYLGRALDCPTE